MTSNFFQAAAVRGAHIRADRLLVLPAFNEEARMSEVLRQVAETELGFEILVVDDGSHDRTAVVARRAGAHVIRHPFNMGYGAALQTGYKYAHRSGATLVVQMDADGQHDFREIPILTKPIEDGTADLVVGSRFLGGESYRMGFARRLGRKVLQTAARSFDLSVTDPTSGFQALNREVLSLYVRDPFPADFPDLDVLLAARRCGIRIEERRVSMAPSPRPSSIHRGLGPTYYLYKMVLSIWAGPSDIPTSRRGSIPYIERKFTDDPRPGGVAGSLSERTDTVELTHRGALGQPFSHHGGAVAGQATLAGGAVHSHLDRRGVGTRVPQHLA